MEHVTHGITLDGVTRFVDIATDALSAAREEIDALNVYPVPDGDTGTNMFLTVSAARDALREARAGDPDLSLGDGMAVLARAALMGARGNSGVILSQMLRAYVRHLAGAAIADRPAETIAAAMAEATEASYAAVGEPVEGTILTVSRAASDAAVEAASRGARTRDVFTAAAAAARDALARTPEQLPVLARAGVVDAGGRGLCVVLDAVETTATGRRPTPWSAPIGTHHIPVAATLPTDDLTEDGPGYEVLYLLDVTPEEEAQRVADLRATLGALGDSLVVVGGDGLWNVHVHVDDVGAAVEAGITAGRPHRIRVTHFAEQASGQAAGQAAGHPAVPAAGGRQRTASRTGRRVVAVAAGPGLAALFESAGAVVVAGGPGRRPSTGQLLEAITGCGAAEVVVLPNDGDTVRAAEIAARTAEAEHDVSVEVIPTMAQVQGLAAVSVHEPGRGFDADVREMTATARHARHGAVTVAARRAITMAGACEPGDALGVIAGDFAVVGSDLEEVATDVLERLLAGGGELVTIVSGEDGEELAQRVAAHVEQRHPHVDVAVHDGGQPRYPLLVSVE
ncbi:MAG TPA: DAK2 domain-containing protein [Nocardioides sp.]|nr:DAK2 domain-containing protein [Nocardioides sp.]